MPDSGDASGSVGCDLPRVEISDRHRLDTEGVLDSDAVVFIADGYGNDSVVETWCLTARMVGIGGSNMIRSYADADLGAVLDVWFEASLVAHPFLSQEFLATERREVADRWLPMAETMVYESDGQVVGFVALIGNEVGAIFVRPDAQGQGIGRALMDRARSVRPYLELDVFEANTTGRAFYDAYGFTVIGSHVHEATGFVELRLRLD